MCSKRKHCLAPCITYAVRTCVQHPPCQRQAKSEWADAEEGRNVFEEGNAFTMEALQQQLDQLSACQDFQVPSPAMVLLIKLASLTHPYDLPGCLCAACAVPLTSHRQSVVKQLKSACIWLKNHRAPLVTYLMSLLCVSQVAEEASVEAAAELLGAAASGWAGARPAELSAARGVEVSNCQAWTSCPGVLLWAFLVARQ